MTFLQKQNYVRPVAKNAGNGYIKAWKSFWYLFTGEGADETGNAALQFPPGENPFPRTLRQ